ncbi:MAG: hypothetical protein LBB78_06295 [Spirochaetaceae bacterium]|jgi:hypothetical protein|nr:hypothetical protein [Spirochaetaceae bacterium]
MNKGGNSRRNWRRDRDNRESEYWSRDKKRGPRYDKNQGIIYERPKWIPPKISADPIPAPDCPFCNKPIKDLSTALSDKATGQAVHFDCAVAKIAGEETLERGDTITYIGGGRFGIVQFSAQEGGRKGSEGSRNFTIKKILEWEDKEHRADWRKNIADHYSVT